MISPRASEVKAWAHAAQLPKPVFGSSAIPLPRKPRFGRAANCMVGNIDISGFVPCQSFKAYAGLRQGGSTLTTAR
jgi:hypothetical protein